MSKQRTAANHWAHVKVSAQFHAGQGGKGQCLHWRLEAKAPEAEWSLRSTVGFGVLSLMDAVPYPPSRDDVLALLVELLMGMEWTAEGVTLS